MRRLIIAVTLVCLLAAWPASLPAQVVNATLSGTVSDTTGALIPGVDVTATHTDTQITAGAVSNETGTYRFPSLRPGVYEVSAALPGFRTQTVQLNLGSGQQIARNFTLEVGEISETIEVSVAADELLTTLVQSVADTLPEQEVADLPLVGRNVAAIAALSVGGVIGGTGATTTFAGIPAQGSRSVNVQVDGMTVNNGRHENGVDAAMAINPDMVAEIRVVVASVDVETAGSSQFQVRTKSGTNEFHGSLVWNNLNSALNANSWENNRVGQDKDWFNRNQWTASLGGPVIRNKTFFFFLFDGQRALTKETVEAVVLTQQARQGIFRFFPGVNNGNFDDAVSGSGNTLTAPVVDALGNPLDWTQVPEATGPMQSFSVFGDALNPGDPFRTGMDPTGFMTRLVGDMPLPNAWNGGDGLNTAIHRWTRRTTPGTLGTGANPLSFDRHQFNLKVDHDFNSSHRLTGSYIVERRTTKNNVLSPWPNGFDGEGGTEPAVYTLSFTSTLSPNLLNEAKFGRRVTTLFWYPPFHNRDQEIQDAAWDYMPVINDTPVLMHPTLFANNIIACQGLCGNIGNKSPLNTFANTLSWTKGSHTFKFGAERRFQSTLGWSSGDVIPHIYGGAGDVPVTGIDTIPGLLPSNESLAENILLSLSGSLDNVIQRYEIREPTDTEFVEYRQTYNHPDNPPNTNARLNDWHLDEFNFFVKDDWRITPNLTLNLGLRYDLIQVPVLRSASGANFTPGLEGGPRTAFGYSGTDFDGWMTGGTERRGQDSRVVMIGEGTDHPDQGVWPGDRNNWAPAIGFAWSPDFLGGRDQTTVRGGYQVTYQLPGDSFSWIDVDVRSAPGFVYVPVDSGDGSFRDFSDINVPVDIGAIRPFEPVPITERAQNLTVHSWDYATPYVQTFTLGVTHSLRSNLTLDVRYVSTRGVKLHETWNLNARDIRGNNLLEALETTRAGGDAEVFDRMLGGLDIGSGVVGVDVTGSEALRRHPDTRADIANGDFVDVASWLNSTNAGTVQTGAGVINGGLLRSSGLFPENFIVANPQFNNVTLADNVNNSTYHSLQVQTTLRETHGINYQATYTWSRNLGVFAAGGDGFRDPTRRHLDYQLQGNHRTHAFRSFGTFRLPFGPGRALGSGAPGWAARLIEGWQIGTIVNLTSGDPLNVTAGQTLYGTGLPDIVGDFPRKGNVVWPDGDKFGNYFPQQYQPVNDPQCTTLALILVSRCTIDALADESGDIVLQHPEPGELGTLGFATIEGPGNWSVDMNIQKEFQISESTSVSLRLDANNVFNHPTPGNPNLNINSGLFGEIDDKNGNRTVQGQIRLDF
jgi:hypothetical protein